MVRSSALGFECVVAVTNSCGCCFVAVLETEPLCNDRVFIGLCGCEIVSNVCQNHNRESQICWNECVNRLSMKIATGWSIHRVDEPTRVAITESGFSVNVSNVRIHDLVVDSVSELLNVHHHPSHNLFVVVVGAVERLRCVPMIVSRWSELTLTLSTIDKLLAVADSEKTLSCDWDKVSRLRSLQ